LGAGGAAVLLALPALEAGFGVGDAVVVELVGITGVGVADAGELDDVVVGDVPVQLGQPAFGLVFVVAARGRMRPAVGVVFRLGGLVGAEQEQLVLHQRTAAVHAVAGFPGARRAQVAAIELGTVAGAVADAAR